MKNRWEDLELRKLNTKQLQKIPTREEPILIAKIRKNQEFETPDTMRNHCQEQ
jgi:hypothetical protein